MMKRLMAIALVALALSACTPSQAGTPEPSAPVPTTKPSALVGAWTVEAPDVPAASVMTMAADGTGYLFAGECYAGIYWRASGSGAATIGTIGIVPKFQCPKGTSEEFPDFLHQVSGFASDGDDVTLLNEGAPIARLSAGGTPPFVPEFEPEAAVIPTLTERDVERLDRAVVLNPSVRPATPPELLGTWRPEVPLTDRSYLTFEDEGRYRAGDGCNGTYGTWASARDGAFVATQGATSLALCGTTDATYPSPQWASAGFDGTVLVVSDAGGEAIIRLVRSPKPSR